MTSLSPWEILLRLSLAFVAAAIIGLERESHGRAAGLRTTVLAGVAAAIAMILSDALFTQTNAANWRPDPARLAAGILAGMGFLGAGAIIKEGNNVRGVTTAALLWFVSILGLAFGDGQYLLGAIGWVMAMVTLHVLPHVEDLIKNDWYGAITVHCDMDGISEDEIRRRLNTHGLRIKKVSLEYDLVQRRRRMRFELKYKKRDLYELSRSVIEDLRTGQGIHELKWE